MFKYFDISSDFFDSTGDRDYTSWSDEKDKRGGLDYYFPKGWNRFGLNVKKKNYDGGRMDWLSMDNSPNEWAVAYHGTKFIALNPIIKGNLRAGSAQAFEGYNNINPASNR